MPAWKPGISRAGRCSPRSFGLGMALLDVTAGNVAVPSVQRDLGTGIRGLSWVIDGYTLTFASALLLAGGLGDRLGARRVFAAASSLFTLASLLCGVAPTIGLLIGARMLQGLGAALFMPSSLALLAGPIRIARERARAIGFWSALTAIAAASGPLWWAVCWSSTLGWRSIFLLNLPLGIAGSPAARYVRPTPATGAAGSICRRSWPPPLAGRRDLGAGRARGARLGLAGGARPAAGRHRRAFAPSFFRMERSAAEPMLPPRLFWHRTFSSTPRRRPLYAAAFFGGLLVLSLFFQRVRGESAALTGLHLTAITVSFWATEHRSVESSPDATDRGPDPRRSRDALHRRLGLSLATARPLVPRPRARCSPCWVIGAGLVAPPMNAAILASVAVLAGIGERRAQRRPADRHRPRRRGVRLALPRPRQGGRGAGLALLGRRPLPDGAGAGRAREQAGRGERTRRRHRRRRRNPLTRRRRSASAAPRCATPSAAGRSSTRARGLREPISGMMRAASDHRRFWLSSAPVAVLSCAGRKSSPAFLPQHFLSFR